MENQPSNGRKAMEEELIKGRDIATQLLEVLVHKSNTHLGDVEEGLMLTFAQDLVRNVLRSFTNTLLLLNTDNNDVSDEVAMPIIIKDVKCPKPEDKDEACKSFFNVKRRSGCHKRKSTAPTWAKNSSVLIEDGYAWRKYGQKMTMNAKYLRSYYRCTHKYDQGCPAIKQVQRIQEDPPLYRTTYYGYHNCKSAFSPEMMWKPASSSDSSMLLSFSNSFPTKEEYPFSTFKQESMEVIQDYHIAHNQLPSSDELLLCDYELDFNCLRHVTVLSSTEYVQVEEDLGFLGYGWEQQLSDEVFELFIF
ncbi:WRKY DNA-binding transcription factor 70-like [Abrus precatorius]|uniref:WRKY DNA-binding transcription factor 70-like n=1 Tax=Abrus precatorius TaxID=3816 RepID=A0A8B8KGL1_ABRPR|nr:WRKY DNA-binding transcription factor 70-like [Abrus precatorius]